MKLLLGRPKTGPALHAPRTAGGSESGATRLLSRAANADQMAPLGAAPAKPVRTLDCTYLRHEPAHCQVPAAAANPAKLHAMARAARPPNSLSSPHLVWGACTPIVRAQLLGSQSLEALLVALTPHQFAFIRSNVFLPPQLQALHARLRTRLAGAAPHTPLGFAIAALVRGGRTDKLAYLFPYFHLLAGSNPPARGGAWFSVENARDVRILGRMAEVLHPTAEPYCPPLLPPPRPARLPAPRPAA